MKALMVSSVMNVGQSNGLEIVLKQRQSLKTGETTLASFNCWLSSANEI